jgi:hypothetical protein
MQFDDDLLIGPVVAGGPNSTASTGVAAGPLLAANHAGGSSPMTRGIGPLGREFVYDQVPLTKQTANIAALQTTAGAGALVLTAGTGVTKVTRADGTFVYQFDIPRAVSLTSAANISAVNFTVSGYDVYGQPMTALLAGPNANTVNTLKAFFQVSSVTVSAAVGTNTSVGSADIFGLPVAVLDGAYLDKVGWTATAGTTFANDTGTFAIADATTPATNATGDVRGTYAPSSASNGVKRLVVSILLPGSAVGPQATRTGALGVTQA